jgi:hypothetical protein
MINDSHAATYSGLAPPAGGPDVPDDGALHADLRALGYRYDVNQRLLVEIKEHMQARNVPPPGGWDAGCADVR